MKLKKLSRSEWAVIIVLIVCAIACFILTFYGLHLVIKGNLFAVIWSTFCAGGAAITSDMAQSAYESIKNK